MTNIVCSQVTTCTDVVKLLRIQRHDFLNHLQVIHAMIQLNRPEKAINYIEKLAHDPNLLSDVLTAYQQQADK